VPGVANVCEPSPFGGISTSNPSPVALCATASRLTQRTVVPAFTVAVAGVYAWFWTTIVPASAVAAGGVPPAGGAPEPDPPGGVP
jgi:hypothetical protein